MSVVILPCTAPTRFVHVNKDKTTIRIAYGGMTVHVIMPNGPDEYWTSGIKAVDILIKGRLCPRHWALRNVFTDDKFIGDQRVPCGLYVPEVSPLWIYFTKSIPDKVHVD